MVKISRSTTLTAGGALSHPRCVLGGESSLSRLSESLLKEDLPTFCPTLIHFRQSSPRNWGIRFQGGGRGGARGGGGVSSVSGYGGQGPL